MRRSFALAASAALLTALAGASLIVAQEAPAGQSETVAGWRIEEVADDFADDDPQARIIRMKREADGHELGYEIRLYSGGGPGWGSSSFSISASGDRNCWRSASAATEIGPPEQRAARVRELLARELRRIERQCAAAPGSLDMLLQGFEPAFARFTALHGELYASIEAAAQDVPENEMAMDANMDMDMNMGMDMNAADMEMNSADPEMPMTDMNMAVEDAEAAEAAADALRAADEALNAIDPK